MIRKTSFSSLVGLLFVILLSCNSYSQWSTDPNNNLIVGYGLLPEIASDSAGGCYITYEGGTTYPRRLTLHRLNRYGYKPWGSGKRILGELPEQRSAKITEDGENGVIVSYLDVDSDNWLYRRTRLRVQRVDSSGNFLWGTTGVRVTISETNQGDQAIVSDGQGGCIVAWVDTLGDLRINRISSGGMRLWGDSGKYVWNSPASPPMISDEQGGNYILYGIGRLQRFRPDGSTYWPPQGVLIPTGPWIMNLDQGNVYLFGSRYVGYNGQLIFSIHLQKVDSSGSILWDSLGVTLDTLNTNLSLSYNFSTQAGYSTIAWPQNTAGIWDLRTQIVRSDGSTVFEYGGVPISRKLSQKGIVGVLPSDSATSVYIWGDNRTPGGIYAQTLDTLGRQMWDTNDVMINIPMFSDMIATTDGNGGCIGVGFHQFDFSIRSLQVSKNGKLGEVITNVADNNKDFPEQFRLYQNYPNPFNSSTIIKYDVPDQDWVTIKLYNPVGQEVKTMVDRHHQAGSYITSIEGGELSSGIYFYRMQTSKKNLVRKLIIIK